MTRTILMTLMAVAFASVTQAAEIALRPQEQSRLARFDEIAGKALLEAMAGGAPGDIAALNKALSGTPQVAFDESLAGDWNCRTMKLGGISALVVYTPFKCRLTFLGDGYSFEKLSGSQRTKGIITLRSGGAVYVGVGYVADQTPPDYADLEPDFEGTGEVQPDIAVFQRTGPKRARLMFPAPVVESDFDILELTR